MKWKPHKNPLRVFIGGETSGKVRDAFRRLGHDAWSCDLLPTKADPKFHYQGDMLDHMNGSFGWDIAIFHPDCTYLCASGLHWNKRRPEREALTDEAVAFVEKLFDAKHIRMRAIENPVGCIPKRTGVKASQYIQPWQFGHDASKKTGLWLFNLPPLKPTKLIPPRLVEWDGKMRERWDNQTDSGQNKLPPSEDRWEIRSETYQGWADAMADQWSKWALEGRDLA